MVSWVGPIISAFPLFAVKLGFFPSVWALLGILGISSGTSEVSGFVCIHTFCLVGMPNHVIVA